MSNELIKFIATGAYSGYSPVAPGTAGSAVGILIYLLAFSLQLSAFSYLLLTISIVLIGIWVSGKAEYIFKRKDSQKIVIDEIAGMLISLFMLPHGFWILLSGFIIFRIIDISKPFYILERLPKGFGVMMDDVAAGIATNLILRIFLFLI
ncbi:MAG: hypothetical protein A2889_08910 [Nitrospinae bacterium RIFCSPLOWO2_01_FULL_39_10]|nr:MAG: hypothetical protein A2889_08910 [Nitrospinae bacterium RIFCSPLOWO2_01_FULL_39_10]